MFSHRLKSSANLSALTLFVFVSV